MKKILQAFILLCLLAPFYFQAQVKHIPGTVTDAITNKPLPYTTVGLKKSLVGVVTNEQGEFDLYLPENSDSDTILVNAFGYRRQAIPVAKVYPGLNIRMPLAAFEIEEVKVKPQPPEFYIRESMRRVKMNYPSEPFNSIAYYREKITENGDFLQFDEAVFKTFCPNYLDTVKNQDQLMLYRKADNIKEMQFMRREIEKAVEKDRKQEEKDRKKAIKKGQVPKQDTAKKKEKETNFSIGENNFGGPEVALKTSRMGQKFWGFLDTNQLDEYRYSWGERTVFGNHTLMVINFASRGKVNHLRESGFIYMDEQSFAIVRVENTGDVVIPVVARPFIFMFGFGVENPEYSRNLEFREVNGKWYPQKIQYHVEAKVVKRYWFEPNDHAHFEIDQIFAVNKLIVDNPLPIPLSKRFSSKKKMVEQVYNDDNLNWGQMNMIKR
jgi:hypothetical protein